MHTEVTSRIEEIVVKFDTRNHWGATSINVEQGHVVVPTCRMWEAVEELVESPVARTKRDRTDTYFNALMINRILGQRRPLEQYPCEPGRTDLFQVFVSPYGARVIEPEYEPDRTSAFANDDRWIFTLVVEEECGYIEAHCVRQVDRPE